MEFRGQMEGQTSRRSFGLSATVDQPNLYAFGWWGKLEPPEETHTDTEKAK